MFVHNGFIVKYTKFISSFNTLSKSYTHRTIYNNSGNHVDIGV